MQKQSGEDSTERERVSTKERPLLGVQLGLGRWEHEPGVARSVVCKRDRKSDFYESVSDFFLSTRFLKYNP